MRWHRALWRTAILPMVLLAAPFSNAPATGQEFQSPTAAAPAPSGSEAIPNRSEAIPNKEVLEYGIEWRLVPAGTARLTWTAQPRPAAPPSTPPGEVRL